MRRYEATNRSLSFHHVHRMLLYPEWHDSSGNSLETHVVWS